MTTQRGEPKSNTVKSVLKAFMIMEELDKEGELGLSELSSRLGIDKGTVHRIITTMKGAGYIAQNQDNKKYLNSLKLFAMGNRVVDKTGIKQIARPFIEELACNSKETASIGLLVGETVMYVDKIESQETIKAGLSIGQSIPLYCTGMGKVILAFSSDSVFESLVKECDYRKFTMHTVGTEKELRAKIDEVRKNGYCVDDEEYVEGLICVAAPIFDYHGMPVGAISISSPKYRYLPEKREEFSKLVVETSGRISRLLGYNKG